MKQISSVLFTVLMLVMSISTSLYAQYQFPDPSFEDWSGATFSGAEQPKYWNYSNVEQLGVKKNFAHKDNNGRSGKCLKIQDQFVGVGPIGATSPGYVALGHPWAYVSSLTSINDATAGTYGGISWNNRPDSMVVWIKRTYDSNPEGGNAAGDHLDEENFHLLYYAWTGTSKGTAYKAKDGSCNTQVVTTKPDYATDEESDVRQALDGNECGTAVQSTQIAEGWYYATARYNDWTKITVPIYYMSDQVPAKCNVILSAGRYPDFRANSGQYAGSTLFVDDIELVYSSAIQKLYVGGKEWKSFDPTNTGVQTYSLGQGVTTIPTIEARRGVGQLTNSRGGKANFQGRRLSASECVINTAGASVDGAPVTITVSAEDGSSTTTYQIQFVSQQSSNPYLSSILLDGAPLAGFNAYVNSYNVSLPYGTTTVPTLTAEAQDGATMTITQATSVNGAATIHTVAQDGVTTQTYTIHFSVAQLSDNTLQNILVDGNPLPGFTPSKGNYTISLPLGTTVAPTITPVSAYPTGAQTITVVSNTLSGGCQITVSAPGAALTKTYKLTYKIEASSYSYLAGIALNGEALANFDAETFSYNITLPMGTTTMPTITWTTGDPYQSVSKTEGGIEGATRIIVTAAAGNTTTYRLNFTVEKSSNSRLGGIALNGDVLAGFDSDVLSYDIALPAGTKQLPTITWTTGDDYQSVRLSTSGLNNPARLIVTAGDGSTSTYVLNFSVEKSASALLQMIFLNGDSLAGFAAETFDYTYQLAEGEQAPRISVTKGDGQTISISQPQAAGLARITVLPEEGEGNVYTIRFRGTNEVVIPEPVFPTYVPSANADLQMIYLNGDSLEGFDAAVTEYTISLPLFTTAQPVLTAYPADHVASLLIITQGDAGTDAKIRVVAEDSVTYKDYTIHFPVLRSSNAAPEDIDVSGYITFDAAQHEYSFELPFGVPFPDVFVTKADERQTVTVEYLNCKTRRDVEITVMAEDSTAATYAIHMLIPTHPDNVLKGIYGDGFALDSITINTMDTVSVLLPMGVDAFAITSIMKNYDDQYVVLQDGGLNAATVLTVYSGRAGESARVYTLLPKQDNPLLLLDLKADNVSVAGFESNRFEYIFPAGSTTPVVTVVASEDAELEVVTETPICWQGRVIVNDIEGPLYTIWFHYPADVTFTQNFEDWASVSNTLADVEMGVPVGWHTPVDATTTGDKGSYDPKSSFSASDDATDGSYSAALKTAYLLTSAEAMPGVLSLSEQSVSVGTYYIVGHTASTLTFGNGITFRNTPDSVALDYKMLANNKVTAWHWKWMTNGQVVFDYTGNYNTKNEWLTIGKRLEYEADFIPSLLDIRINPSQSENLSDYYVGTGGASTRNRFTSSMLVDNLRILYNSELKGIIYNGVTIVPDASKHFEITLPTEFVGVPTLGFVHGVADQATTITWSNEVAGVRTATIRNYAEDGSCTDYTLTAARPLSTEAGIVLLGGAALTPARAAMDVSPLANLHFRTASPHAAATVQIVADSMIVVVTPEAGAPVRTAFSAFTHDTIRNVLLGEIFIGQDSIMVDSAATVYSNVLNLQAILLGEDTLNGYDPYELDYECYTASVQTVTALPSDKQQTVTVATQTLSDGSDLTYIYVRAGNGAQRVYSLRQIHTLPSTDASLATLVYDLNGVETAVLNFAPTAYTYAVDLPAHSQLPDVSATPTDVNAIVSMSRTGNSVSLLVTAEDGVTTQTYTIDFSIALSDYSSLTDIMVGGAPLDNFDAAQLEYNVALPTGTTALPSIDYTKLENAETVVIDTTVLSNFAGQYTLTVTAEDGVHQSVYTIYFTVAKSSNADLNSLTVDGTPIAGFDAEQLTYAATLPYGYMCVPEIRYETEDAAATVLVSSTIEKATIIVTAEDGVTTKTYTVNFSVARSTNAELNMIFLNGDSLSGYDKENLEYHCTYAYGTLMPTVTYTAGDEQQTVATAIADNVVTLTVTAGDGETINEYVLIFVQQLSGNNYLSDLQLKGKTIDGFHRDSIVYHIIYPVGTAESALLTKDDVVATPEDANAVVVVNEDVSHTLTIVVTAPNGDVRAYVVHQEILLSSEARLKMIYLNEVALADFDPDVFEYTYVIQQGATTPAAVGEALDERASVEYGLLTDEEGGSYIEIDGVAEDGTTLTYTIHYVEANWSPSPDVTTDDYLFYYAGDGVYKAVTIGLNVTINIYDTDGRRVAYGDVPTADPNDVIVEVDADGHRKLVSADPDAAGFVFIEAKPNTIYFYTFFDVRNKRVAKGGKVCFVM